MRGVMEGGDGKIGDLEGFSTCHILSICLHV